MGVSIEGFEEDILRILKEIENRRCFIKKSNEKREKECCRVQGMTES